MKQLVRKAYGFTLVEILIVVAIIGVLAAIAIPQFASYRMRAFNASAESDVRNTISAEDVLMSDSHVYGSTGETTLPGIGHPSSGKGTLLVGPKSAATAEMAGALLQGTSTNGEKHAVGLGVGNGVLLQADTMATGDISFNIYGRHFLGNRAYASETESTVILICEHGDWVGQVTIMATMYPVQTSAGDLFNKPCGGALSPNWLIL